MKSNKRSGDGIVSVEAIEWDGQIAAVLIHGKQGDYLSPPIVVDADGHAVMGIEALEAIRRIAVGVELPVIVDPTPQQVAELRRRFAKVSLVDEMNRLRDHALRSLKEGLERAWTEVSRDLVQRMGGTAPGSSRSPRPSGSRRQGVGAPS